MYPVYRVLNVQTYPRDIVDLAPYHRNEASITVTTVVIFFAGIGSCAQLVKKRNICEAQ